MTAGSRAVGKRLKFATICIATCLFLNACEDWVPPLEEHYKGVDVYRDRFEYRYKSYVSLRRLGIAIEASPDPVEVLNIRECVDNERLADVIDVLRAHGQQNFAIVQPPHPC